MREFIAPANYRAMKKIILCTVLSFSTLSIVAKEHKADTLTVSTSPEMHCVGCETKIKENIRFVKGVKKIITSVSDQKVTIIYDPKKANYNAFVAAFKKIGYDIKKKEDQ